MLLHASKSRGTTPEKVFAASLWSLTRRTRPVLPKVGEQLLRAERRPAGRSLNYRRRMAGLGTAQHHHQTHEHINHKVTVTGTVTRGRERGRQESGRSRECGGQTGIRGSARQQPDDGQQRLAASNLDLGQRCFVGPLFYLGDGNLVVWIDPAMH